MRYFISVSVIPALSITCLPGVSVARSWSCPVRRGSVVAQSDLAEFQRAEILHVRFALSRHTVVLLAVKRRVVRFGDLPRDLLVREVQHDSGPDVRLRAGVENRDLVLSAGLDSHMPKDRV